MSECVVRMKTPPSCYVCPLRITCVLYKKWLANEADMPYVYEDGCLIVCQLPEGHGRLIDASTIIGEVDAGYTDDYGNPIPVNRPVSVDEYLGLEVPTIVPAERSETK